MVVFLDSEDEEVLEEADEVRRCKEREAR